MLFRSCQAFTVVQSVATVVTEIHNSSHTPVTTVLSGTVVHAKTTVGGNNGTPTGIVAWMLHADGTCSSAYQPLSSANLDSSGVAHPSGDSVPMPAGTWSILATYSGDSTYNQTINCQAFTVVE